MMRLTSNCEKREKRWTKILKIGKQSKKQNRIQRWRRLPLRFVFKEFKNVAGEGNFVKVKNLEVGIRLPPQGGKV